MSDRLNELRRQRILIQEQLTFVDREIAAEIGRMPDPPPPASLSTLPQAPVAAAPAPSPIPSAMRTNPGLVAEEILAHYQPRGGNMAQDVKRGCIIYFAVGMCLLVIGVAGAYLIYSRR